MQDPLHATHPFVFLVEVGDAGGQRIDPFVS